MTIEVEGGLEQAMFRCRHERNDAQIGWLMNRTTIQQYPDVLVGSFRDMNDSLVETLTIPAISRYNESEVVCDAIFSDGSPREETLPVALIISGTCLLQMYSQVFLCMNLIYYIAGNFCGVLIFVIFMVRVCGCDLCVSAFLE